MISPTCRVVEVLVARSCRSASPSGPIFLYQDRSIRCEANFCPLFSRFVEVRRCVRGLKNPNEVEKFDAIFCFGWVRVWVKFDSSRAKIIPMAVTTRAAVFVRVGMVMGGVFVGVRYDVISSPARMLPRARRRMGEVMVGLFSSMGVIVAVRVNPVWTSRVMRRL